MLISDPCPGVRWTSSNVVNTTKNYVHKNRYVHSEPVLSKYDTDKQLDAHQSIAILREAIISSKGLLTIYEPAEILYQDLVYLNLFPKNELLFKKGDEMNYLESPKYLMDQEDREFMSKPDVFLALLTHINKLLDGKKDNGLYMHIVKSFGNRIGRQLKGSFEMVPTEVVDAVLSATSEVFGLAHTLQVMKRGSRAGLKLSKYTLDEVYQQFAEFYDESYDQILLKDLKSELETLIKSMPLKQSSEWYNQAYMLHTLIYDSLGTISNRYPVAFLPYSKVKKPVKKHTPCVRLFVDNDEKFLFAKEVEIAVSMAIKNKAKSKPLREGLIVIETIEERKRGILMSISWFKYLEVLKECGLVRDSIAVIEENIKRTSRNYATPLVTPYGTHCKLASDAFFELFDNIAFGMNAFQRVKPEHLSQIEKWLNKQMSYFVENKKRKYFLDCKSLQTVIGNAYKDLEQFLTEFSHDIRAGDFSKQQLNEEVVKNLKLSRVFPDIVDKIAVKFVDMAKQAKTDRLSRKDVLSLVDQCLKMCFFVKFPKFAKFVHSQGACNALKKFPCDCRNITEKKPADYERLKNNPLRFIEQKNMTVRISDALIVIDDVSHYELVSISGRKFCTNHTAIVIAFNEFLSKIPDQYEDCVLLVMRTLTGQMRADRDMDTFYMTEEEMHEFVYNMSAKFERAYTNEHEKVVAHSKSQMHEVPWEDLTTNFQVFFSGTYSREELMSELKFKMRRFKEATKTGVLAFLMCKVFTACRQVHCFFQKMIKRLRNLETYMNSNPDRTILMRMMSSIKVESSDAMFVFTDEVIKVVRIILKQEKRWSDENQDQLEKYETDWSTPNGFRTIPVMQICQIMEDFQLVKSRLLILPDDEYMVRRQNIPLQMGYNVMEVRGPGNEMCMHINQAQYFIFQKVCCDITWMLERRTCPNHVKCSNNFQQKIIAQLAKLGDFQENTYIPTSKVDEMIEELHDDIVYRDAKMKKLITPFILLHGEMHSYEVKKDQFLELVGLIIDSCEKNSKITMVAEKFLGLIGYGNSGLAKYQFPEAWRVRYVFMKYWIDSFFNDEKKLIVEVTKAWTFNLPQIYLESIDDFNDWFATMGKYPNKYVDFERIEQHEKTYTTSNQEDDFADMCKPHIWMKCGCSNDKCVDHKETEYAVKRVAEMLKIEEENNAKASTPEPSQIDTSFSFMKRGFLNKPDVSKTENEKTAEVVPKPAKKVNKKSIEERVRTFSEKVVKLMPNAFCHFDEDKTCNLDQLNAVLQNVFQEEYKLEERQCMALVINGEQVYFKIFEENVRKYFIFSYVDGEWRLKLRSDVKPVVKQNKKGKKKGSNQVEQPSNQQKLETQIRSIVDHFSNEPDIEKKLVSVFDAMKLNENDPTKPNKKGSESCKTCKKVVGEIEELKKDLTKHAKSLKTSDKKLETMMKTITEKEVEVEVMRSQIAQLKQQSRDETKKLKDDISKKDKSILALQQQFKREEEKESLWRAESEELYGVMRKQLQKAHDDYQLLEEQLVEGKSSETKNAEQISYLTFQNHELIARNQTIVKTLGELQQSIQHWQNVVFEKDSMLTALQSRIGQIHTSFPFGLPHSPMLSPPITTPVLFSPTTQTASQPQMSPDVQSKLAELEDTLKSLQEMELIQQAKNIFTKFVELCNNPLEIEAAVNELKHFEEKYDGYVRIVQQNIYVIKENAGITVLDLMPLPELPLPFSCGFVKAYEKCMKKMPKTWNDSDKTDPSSADREIEDPECLICTADIDNSQKTTKCENCSRRYHSECVSLWLKKNSICPVCRNALPDPKEYPDLV